MDILNQASPVKSELSLELDLDKSFGASSLPIAIKGIKGDTLYMNKQAKMLSVLSKGSIFVSYDEKLPEEVLQINKMGIATVDKKIEFRNENGNLEKKFFQVESITLLNKFGLFYGTLFIYNDLTSLVDFIEKSETSMNDRTFDEMTEMLLKNQFDYILSKETERASRYSFPLSLSVFFFDNLRFLGQSLGNEHLNQALKTIGTYFKQNLRKSDIIFRIEFNDFICILPHTNYENACNKFNKMKGGLSEVLKFSDNIKPVLNFGISEFNVKKHYKNYNSMIEEAKEDLKKKKSVSR